MRTSAELLQDAGLANRRTGKAQSLVGQDTLCLRSLQRVAIRTLRSDHQRLVTGSWICPVSVARLILRVFCCCQGCYRAGLGSQALSIVFLVGFFTSDLSVAFVVNIKLCAWGPFKSDLKPPTRPQEVADGLATVLFAVNALPSHKNDCRDTGPTIFWHSLKPRCSFLCRGPGS